MSIARKIGNLGTALDSAALSTFLSKGTTDGEFDTIAWGDVTGKPSYIDSSLATQLFDSAYIQLRQSAVSSGGLDSAAVVSLIDSSYVAARAGTGSSGFVMYNYNATAGQTAFQDSDTAGNVLSYTANGILVYYNGLLLADEDYTATDGSAVTLTEGADSGAQITIGKWNLTGSGSSGSAEIAPWTVDLDNITYDTGVTFSTANEDINPREVVFKPDGSKMYINGATNDTVYQYSLSTPWDLSTASYDNASWNHNVTGTLLSAAFGLFFKPDGMKLYMTDYTLDGIYQFSLSTPWDITSVNDTADTSISISSVDGTSQNLVFSPDGTKMFFVGLGNDKVYQYSLSTAWDLSTASYDNVSIAIISYDSAPRSLRFNNDGTQLFVTGSTGDLVLGFDLTSPYDLSTASFNKSLDLNPVITAFADLAFSSDGTKMYAVCSANDAVYQYSTGL